MECAGADFRIRVNSLPRAEIVAVTTDRRYTNLSEIEPAVDGARITFDYNSIDFKTHPEKRIYRYKLQGYEDDWNPPTQATQIDYADLTIGEYTFFVQAIDRDGNYSEPETAAVVVQANPRILALETAVDQLRHEVGRKYYLTSVRYKVADHLRV